MPGAEREGSLVTQDGERPESVSPRRVLRAVTANAVSGLTVGPQPARKGPPGGRWGRTEP